LVFQALFSFRPPHQNPVHVSPLSHACHMPRPPNSPWFDLPNNIWLWVQIMKLPIVQLSLFSLYFNPCSYISTQNISYKSYTAVHQNPRL
jgi:hypothetical protein